VEATDPAGPLDGQIWIRSTDLQRFTYSDSLSKWLGELRVLDYGHQNATYIGFLNHNPRTTTDTTTAAEVGYLMDGVQRLMKAELRGANTPTSCTTQVWADQTLAIKLSWENAQTSVVTPTADSTGGWVAAAERVVFADGSTISANTFTGTTAASNPTVSLFIREEVTP
jgi:hypothetical protein